MAYSPMLSTMERSRRSLSRRASCAARCSVASRIKLTTAGPAAVSMGLSMMSTGNSVPSLRRPKRLSVRAHLASARCGVVILAMAGMAAAKPRRHEHLDRLADELLAGVAEQLFDARICGAHDAVSVRDEDRVRRKLKQPFDCILGKNRLHAVLAQPRAARGNPRGPCCATDLS